MYECIIGVYVCVQACVTMGVTNALSVTLSPAPVLPALYLTLQLTCLSTVIFESLVISAAWFRRSTTWKEGRARCHTQHVLPGQASPHSPPELCCLGSVMQRQESHSHYQALSSTHSPSQKWSCHQCLVLPLV